MTPTLPAGVTRSAALKTLRNVLADAGVDDGAADARVLLCAAGGISGLDLIREPDLALNAATLQRLAPMARRRAAGEPVSRILARREFWGLPLAISPAVLDPRPDTETLVEAVVREFAPRRHAPLRLLDLGAGSGAILCALLKEFDAATGVAVDLSPAAAAMARANLAACGLATRSQVAVASWGEALCERFDVVVSNPPYIAHAEIGGLAREVKDHDPALALDGGSDGLDAYRAIGPQLAALLATDGRFFLEVGVGQADPVLTILAGVGLTDLATYNDLAGLVRVVRGGAPVAAFDSIAGEGPRSEKTASENMPLGAERKKD
jgi:release factor glutamine methyltransferase